MSRLVRDGLLWFIIYFAMLAVSVFVPGMGVLLYMALPVPFIVMQAKHGFRGGGAFSAAAVILSIISGGLEAVWLALLPGLAGIVMGELIRREKPAFGVWLGGALSNLANFLLLLLYTKLVLRINPIAEAQKGVEDVLEETGRLEQQTGGAGGQAELIKEQVEMLPSLLPSTMIIVAAVIALITFLLARFVMKKQGIEAKKLPPFREWNFPKSFVWYYLAAIILVFMNPEKGTTLHMITVNLYSLLSVVFTVQGLSLVFYWSWVKKKSKAFPVLISAVILLSSGILPLLMEVVKFLGIIDIGFNVKNRLKPKQ
ncbi:YybS family protein [Fictibacillus iocasae]|uniref:YybS family protein n=1 Tax=Fictibacillus iocasae TaxID=2715437 RepID=A0ABW2NNS8_9BACL